MSELPSSKAVSEFWSWFSKESEALTGDISDAVANEIRKRIAKVSPDLGWEIGPGSKSRQQFCVTLNGSCENIPIAEAVIRAAPAVPEWEFHAGRPAKLWDFAFEMTNRRGQRVSIDAESWEYTLIGFSNNSFFDITLLASNLPRMDKVAKQEAAWIVIQGAIGEKQALERIGEVTIAETSAGIDITRANSIAHLSNHIEMLSNENQGLMN